jgi:hypothetical protein
VTKKKIRPAMEKAAEMLPFPFSDNPCGGDFSLSNRVGKGYATCCLDQLTMMNPQ